MTAPPLRAARPVGRPLTPGNADLTCRVSLNLTPAQHRELRLLVVDTKKSAGTLLREMLDFVLAARAKAVKAKAADAAVERADQAEAAADAAERVARPATKGAGRKAA